MLFGSQQAAWPEVAYFLPFYCYDGLQHSTPARNMSLTRRQIVIRVEIGDCLLLIILISHMCASVQSRGVGQALRPPKRAG